MTKKSSLNQIIPPEISNDSFYKAIVEICSDSSIKTALEIGSSAGQGSTLAFVTGLTEGKGSEVDKSLFCIEVSTVRSAALADFYKNQDLVHCYNCSSVPLDDFPKPQEVINFYYSKDTGLKKFGLKEVLRWLQQDIDYVATQNVPGNGIERIKQENNIDYFDVVLIDGSEFTGKAELDEVYGARYIFLDDINTFKNYENHDRLLLDRQYKLIAEDRGVRNGFSIFERVDQEPQINRDIPIHFFTIVLNGQPFIEYHVDLFSQFNFKWHWHIVEGVAALKHDTAWSIAQGGRVDNSWHNNGLSQDGTSEYLNNLARQHPDKVSLYRKSEGEFWDGKCEMVNAPLEKIKEECLLWQIDVDEFWTADQIVKGRELFIRYPHKTAAYYWCQYFVGSNLFVSSRNCYSQNPSQDWLRTWRFQPGMEWIAHEPPTLCKTMSDGNKLNLAEINPFLHSRTEREGLIFQHFAYLTREQLLFKEKYYGYKNALSDWLRLNSREKFPVFLRDYFEWVTDDTTVDLTDNFGIVPIAKIDHENNLIYSAETSQSIVKPALKYRKPKILVDGVFFQLLNSGIGRVWKTLFEEWSDGDFSKHLLILDRDGTAPKVEGIRYKKIHPYLRDFPSVDSFLLQKICDEEDADLFLSTYYTTPITTPSALLLYDMIPEVMNVDLETWQEKTYSLIHASGYIGISQNTIQDFKSFYPQLAEKCPTTVAYCGVSKYFKPASPDVVQSFREKYKLQKPFFCTVGERFGFNGYKNVKLLFEALSQLENKSDLSVLCIGGNESLEKELYDLAQGIDVILVQVSDDELAMAYSAAVALVYPSMYEGFGMPIVEAMACGCPVITCNNSSIPEVAGDAAIYVNESSTEDMLLALRAVQDPKRRQTVIEDGILQAQKFSWSHMANQISKFALDVIKNKPFSHDRTTLLWRELRAWQCKEQDVTSGSEAEIFMLTQGDKTSDSRLLYKTLEEIKAVEQSKLWKIRNMVFKIKRAIRGGFDNSPSINPNNPPSLQLTQAKSKLEWMRNSKFLKLKRHLDSSNSNS